MTVSNSPKKKLIEVALPLPEINDASVYDKMPGIGSGPEGHPPLVGTPTATDRARHSFPPWSSMIQKPTLRNGLRKTSRTWSGNGFSTSCGA